MRENNFNTTKVNMADGKMLSKVYTIYGKMNQRENDGLYP